MKDHFLEKARLHNREKLRVTVPESPGMGLGEHMARGEEETNKRSKFMQDQSPKLDLGLQEALDADFMS